MNKLPYLVFAGSVSRNLAEKICDSLGCPLGKMRTERFADGKFAIFYEESIRGGDIFLVQSTYLNADSTMGLLLMIDAARRVSACYVTTVMPYFRWTRQDRKDKPRVSIGAKLITDLLSVAGIIYLITMNLHADQVQGFFNVPVDHLYGSTVLTEYIRHSVPMENLYIATPDVGGTRRANSCARHLGVPMVIYHKRRAKANEVAEMTVAGDVAGKDIIPAGDIVDTAGTVTKAADLILEYGAKFVRAFATRAVISGPATKHVDQSGLTGMIFTSLTPYSKKDEKVCIINVAELSAESIRRVCSHKPISSLYTFQTHFIYNKVS